MASFIITSGSVNPGRTIAKRVPRGFYGAGRPAARDRNGISSPVNAGTFTDHELSLVAGWRDMELERGALSPALHHALTMRVSAYVDANRGGADAAPNNDVNDLL